MIIPEISPNRLKLINFRSNSVLIGKVEQSRLYFSSSDKRTFTFFLLRQSNRLSNSRNFIITLTPLQIFLNRPRPI